MTLYAGRALGEHPMWNETTVTVVLRVRNVISQLPGADALAASQLLSSLPNCPWADLMRKVLPDGVSVISVHTPFALFQVNRVGWEIPMNDGVTVPVEVKPFLPYRGRAQHEGPEGRVERCADVVQVQASLLIRGTAPVTYVSSREVLTHRNQLPRHTVRRGFPCRRSPEDGRQVGRRCKARPRGRLHLHIRPLTPE